MIGLPPISIIGFGRRTDSSLMRVPAPPARITALRLQRYSGGRFERAAMIARR